MGWIDELLLIHILIIPDDAVTTLVTMGITTMAMLPKPGDPFITSTGIIIRDDDTGEFSMTSAESYNERLKIQLFKQFTPSFEMTQDTMPEGDVKEQIVISAIISMRIIGLSFEDIADMLGTSHDEITRVVNLPSTQKTFEALFKGIIAVNATSTQGRISAFSNNAVDVVLQLMNNEDTRDDVRLKSAQDILDRSGTNAEHFFAKDKDSRSGQDDELRITIMDEEGTKERVSVDIKRSR